MLAEAITKIQELAVGDFKPMLLAVPGEAEHIARIVDSDGVVQKVTLTPRPRNHRAADLDTLLMWAQKEPPKSVVWFSRKGVVVLLDDDTRRDRVEMPLELSFEVKKLQMLESSLPWHDQKGLLYILRVMFHDCLGAAGNLVDVIRRLKFRQNAAGEATLQHGKASIGRQLQSELTGEGAVPETVQLSVPIFANGCQELRGYVGCALEIDSATEKFQLIPFPGQIELAIRDAEVSLGRKITEGLAESGVPAFYGCP